MHVHGPPGETAWEANNNFEGSKNGHASIGAAGNNCNSDADQVGGSHANIAGGATV